MTTAATRIAEIFKIEQFSILVYENGNLINVIENGKMAAYPRRNKTKGALTVADYMKIFSTYYLGLTCKVLLNDGNIAPGQTLLSTVRNGYENDEADD